MKHDVTWTVQTTQGQQCHAMRDTPCWHERALSFNGSTQALECLTLALCTGGDFKDLEHQHQWLSEWVLN